MKNYRLIIFSSLFILLNSCSQEQQLSNGMTEKTIEKRHQTYVQPAITDACNLTFSIDPCFQSVPEYMDAFEDAVELYNNIPNVGINVSIVSANADIHFDCLVNFPCFGGEAILGGTANEFYDGNDETNSIYLNVDMPEIEECCGDNFNLCSMTGLIAHEVGHVIGLDHTNSPDGVHIPGTPTSDQYSVFNGGNFCTSKCKFTYWDIIALRIVHPPCSCGAPPSFTITYDGPTCLNEIETFGIDANFDPQDLDVVGWSVSNNLQIINSGSQSATIKATGAGSASVCADVKNMCDIEATECYFFYVSPYPNCADDGSSPPGPGGLGPN